MRGALGQEECSRSEKVLVRGPAPALVAEHLSFGGDDQGGRQAGELLEAGAHREAVRSARWAVPIERLATTPPSAYDSARIPRRGGAALMCERPATHQEHQGDEN